MNTPTEPPNDDITGAHQLASLLAAILVTAFARSQPLVLYESGAIKLNGALIHELLHPHLLNFCVDLRKTESALIAHLARLVSEVNFVLKGGDDPFDKCPDCGLAGVGMLRDELRKAKVMLGKVGEK